MHVMYGSLLFAVNSLYRVNQQTGTPRVSASVDNVFVVDASKAKH